MALKSDVSTSSVTMVDETVNSNETEKDIAERIRKIESYLMIRKECN